MCLKLFKVYCPPPSSFLLYEFFRKREPWKGKLKSKLGHVRNYRRNEITSSEDPLYHIHCNNVYLCENHSVSGNEIEGDLNDLWNEDDVKIRFL